MCYKIIYNEIAIPNDDFLVFSKLTHTRGHNYKLFKAVPWLIHTSISFRIALLKSEMVCLVQW